MNTLKIVGILVVLITIGLVYWEHEQIKSESHTVGLANPASVFCTEHGGHLKIVKGEKGEYGICILKDGTECEEWAFYRGECPSE